MKSHFDKAHLFSRLPANQPVTKARVQQGGETGTVLTFISQCNQRVTYSMPNVFAGREVVEALVAEHPERFPLTLTSASHTRAVYKRP